ncbi:LOW QUALITY PROTEIN: NFX1-type zinc finger-containing protein 1-like [Pecten maximus]|uniref:LOW QUALITY PROTEIN: NFX1-type zinc finger-containing protein 1-like n=1 Tax=Pecten maximus TaxID=6579 RepID=UPI0014591A1A|nr:LOW QUALITY PROTEIN: NFX1-type zinc finger-containing protein 1-like [Pecten maximus]
MDSDDEYDFNPGSRAGPIKILNLDEDAPRDVNNSRRNRENSRGKERRPQRGTDTSQSRDDGIRGRGGRGGRGNGRGRGDGRGRGRGGRGGRGQASGVSGQEGFDLRRYSSLSRLDNGSKREEAQNDANPTYNAEPRQRRSASRPRPDRIFGYRKLEELSKKTNTDDILMEILSESSGFQTLLKNNNMQNDWSKLLISVLGKACSSHKSHSKLQLVGLLVKENVMMLQVTTFLGKIHSRCVAISPDQLDSLIQDVCKIMKELMQRMPQEAHSISSAVVMLNVIANDPSFHLQQNQDISNLINEISLTKDTIVKDLDNQRRERNMQPGGRRNQRDMESLPPPDNFRDLPILPNLRDLQFNEKPFLRRNKVDGCYDDLHHYLDVQFRLLREDYIQPLRNGITEYRRGKKDVKQRFQDIRLYHKVKVVRPICSNSGILHVIQFDVSKMKNMRWESSRRLLHGSLVCLSQNDFETILFATVTNRDVKLLSQGLIEVQFKNNFQSVFEIKPSEEFIMAETTAYFEAYRHILRGLQEIEDGLPMQRYIVECKQALKPPKYLQNELHYYDFSPLLPENHCDEVYVPVINTRQWPSAKALKLDKSQYQALQMALTKEMALIQGPPGTGKTFVGLKIMQLLLHNSDVWRRSHVIEEDDETNDSILVVCYTNHALDQFLEGVSEFCDSIVRIGGRCSNPALEPFMLSNLRKEARMKRQIPKLIWERKADCRKQMNLLKDKIEDVSAKLDASRLGLMHEKTLELFIKEEHYRELVSGRLRNKDISAIYYWLASDLHNVVPHTEEDSSSKSTATEYSTYSKWIDNVINGPTFDLGIADILQGDLWNKKLVERLCIYKQWVSSYIAYKQKCMDDITEEIQALVEGNRKSDKNNLQHQQIQLGNVRKDVQTAETRVMTENTLKDGLRIELRKHLERLLRTKPQMSLNCSVVEHWLHIDDTSDSEGLFTEALEVIASISETIDTLEEAEAAEMERTIVDKNDEEENDRSKTHEAMLSKAMSDLSYSFTGGDNEAGTPGANTEWQTATSQKTTKEVMRRMLEQSQAMSDKEEARQPVDVWNLSVGARFSLYKLWLSRYQDHLSSSIQDIVQQYSDVCDVNQEVMDSEDVDIISGSRVIAMTTTGAAKYRNILRSVNPKIIVVEEAAEVLESHIVSTINSNCQHLILIGDHKQLRPTPTVYQLAVNYNLEISLFERMIKNEMNYVTLELQHRMRPEISNHMRLIYPDLRDHPSVFGKKNVLGIATNMHFIDHSFTETFYSETKSRSNSHEAEFIVGLCKYLLQQGYLSTQITVLTTYTGQVFALKKLMPKREFEGVRVTAVDNYQGEENDIILLSLVRSNSDDSVGFLKTDNRVCVALSRAKMGFYVIGNFTLLSSQSTLWTNIVQTLKKNDAFGSYLTLKCQNHPEKTVNASLRSDFSKTPDGGCTTPCNTRLPCGHVCEKFCHITDRDHKRYRCLKPCAETICIKGHVCTKKCWQECGKCMQNVVKTIPSCGHDQSGPCHQDALTLKCQSKCGKTLSCGHKCDGICGKCKESNTHQLQCQELIKRKLICGHSIQCKCFQMKYGYLMYENCTTKLDCDHPCSGTCGSCFQGRLHMPCFEKCTKMLICGHKCGQKCGEPCPPCVKKCSLSCEHSSCSLICGKPCLNCTEPCTRSCDHQKCTKLCHEICDRLPCDMPCPKKLGCGHNCSGLCEEMCPRICFYCNETKAKEIFKDATPATRFIMLEDCMHTFEKETMDNWMNADILSSKTFSYLEVNKCPTCNKPINNSKRYGNIIKQTRGLVNEVKQQLIGSKRKILTHCQQMKTSVAKLQPVDAESFNILMRKLEPVAQVTMASLEVVDIQRKATAEYQRQTANIGSMNVKVSLHLLKTWVTETKFKPNKTDIKSKLRQSFTPQELAEVREEMLRLAYIVEVIRCAEHSQKSQPSLATQYVDIHDILEDGRPMTETLDEKLIKIFKSLSDRDPSCQPIVEKRCIEKSMKDFAQKGRWIKCNEANHLLSGETTLGPECPRCIRAKSDKNTNASHQKLSQTRGSLQVADKILGQRKYDADLSSTPLSTLATYPGSTRNDGIDISADRMIRHGQLTNSVATQQAKSGEYSDYDFEKLSSNSSTRIVGEKGCITPTEETRPIPKPRKNKIEVPKAYDVMDWETSPPKPRKTRDPERDGADLKFNEYSTKQTAYSGLAAQISSDTGRWITSSETTLSRAKSDASPRISYDRESLVQLGSSPLSHVFLPCLQRADLPKEVSILNRSTKTATTDKKGDTEEVQLGLIRKAAVSSGEVIGRDQNSPVVLQWTDPKPVGSMTGKSSSQVLTESTKSYYTPQVDTKMVNTITPYEAMEGRAGAAGKVKVPTREVTGKEGNTSAGLQWTDQSTKRYYTAQVDVMMDKSSSFFDNITSSMEERTGATRNVATRELIRSEQYNPAKLQWTDPKPVASVAAQASVVNPTGTKKTYFTPQTDAKMELDSSRYELHPDRKRLTGNVYSGGGTNPVGDQWTDAKPVRREPQVGDQWTDAKPVRREPQATPGEETEFEKTYRMVMKKSQREPDPAIEPAQKKSEILFQCTCIEPGCAEQEAPGYSGRCQKHYAKREVSLLAKIKNFIAK